MAAKHIALEAQLAQAGGTATLRLRLFLREFWAMSLTPQAGLFQRLLASEIVTEAPDIFAAWARGLVQRWRFVEALIREGQRTGEFRRDANPTAAARLVVSALSHQALLHVHFGVNRFAPYPTEALFEGLVDQCLYGLRTPVRRVRRRK